ncbi:MAG: hypothetical protein Q9207_005348 [Kuettlingeria erythrocarpa]
MDNYEDFDEVFAFDPLFAYSEQTINKILQCRTRSMEHELFIDRLLTTLGLDKRQCGDARSLYPPRSNQDLRDLHQQIIESPSPDHHQQSVLYYILKDIVPTKDVHHPASAFAEAVFLPERYRIFMDGIYHLDRAQFAKALDYLTEPVLIPTFPEEIMYTLCTHPEQRDEQLPLVYYYTVSPALTSPKVVAAFFAVLAKASVAEAFFWARKQGEPSHRSLFEQLINDVLDAPEGDDRARKSVELIHLPFSGREEAWFDAYLGQGRGKNLPGAEDTLSVRRTMTSRSGAVADSDKDFGAKSSDGMDWSSLGASVEGGSMMAR